MSQTEQKDAMTLRAERLYETYLIANLEYDDAVTAFKEANANDLETLNQLRDRRNGAYKEVTNAVRDTRKSLGEFTFTSVKERGFDPVKLLTVAQKHGIDMQTLLDEGVLVLSANREKAQAYLSSDADLLDEALKVAYFEREKSNRVNGPGEVGQWP